MNRIKLIIIGWLLLVALPAFCDLFIRINPKDIGCKIEYYNEFACGAPEEFDVVDSTLIIIDPKTNKKITLISKDGKKLSTYNYEKYIPLMSSISTLDINPGGKGVFGIAGELLFIDDYRITKIYSLLNSPLETNLCGVG
jgi:hypothetical protein